MDLIWLWLILVGFAIGFVAIIGGFGGGVFLVPFLDIVLGNIITLSDAREVSFFMIFANSLVGCILYFKQKRIHVKLGLIAAVCTVSGSLITKIFLSGLSNQIIRLIFGIFLCILSVYFILQFIWYYQKKKVAKEDSDGIGEMPIISNRLQYIKAIPLFLLTGFLAALTGTGGGYLNVPTVNLLFDFPIHYSTSTSSFIILFTSGFNLISGLFQGKGYLYIQFGIYAAIGGIIGARTGAKISYKFPKHGLKGIFGIILLYIGINMILKFAGII